VTDVCLAAKNVAIGTAPPHPFLSCESERMRWAPPAAHRRRRHWHDAIPTHHHRVPRSRRHPTPTVGARPHRWAAPGGRAARHYGLWSGLDRRVHVTVTRGASRLRPRNGARVHWVEPGRQDLSSPSTWRVSLAECLRGMVRCSTREDAIACLDTAITLYRLSPSRIRSIFQSQPARSRAIAAAARAGSESGAESIVRQRIVQKARPDDWWPLDRQSSRATGYRRAAQFREDQRDEHGEQQDDGALRSAIHALNGTSDAPRATERNESGPALWELPETTSR